MFYALLVCLYLFAWTWIQHSQICIADYFSYNMFIQEYDSEFSEITGQFFQYFAHISEKMLSNMRIIID